MTGYIIHIEREEALKVDPTCAEAWRSKSGACRLQFEGSAWPAGQGPEKGKSPRQSLSVSYCGVCIGALGAFGVDFYVLEKDLE